MRFLIEKSILTDEEQRKFDTSNPYKQHKYIENYIKNLPNSKYLNKAKSIYIQSLLDNGFDLDDNPFLNFMQNIKIDLDYNIVNLIKVLIENENLNSNEDWLYKTEFYNEDDPKNLLFKIKAYTYASNKDLQLNTSKQINVKDLEGKSILEIQNILNNINSKKLTIDSALLKLYPNTKTTTDKINILISLLALKLNATNSKKFNRKLLKLESKPRLLKNLLNIKINKIDVDEIIDKIISYLKEV